MASKFYYALQFSESAFVGMEQPGTQVNLSMSLAVRQRIFCPALSQQIKIAAILKSIDTTIEESESLIEMHQHIKAGLMQDLLTGKVQVV